MDINATVEGVARNKEKWASLSFNEKIALLRVLVENTERYADEWGRAGLEVRGIQQGTAPHVEGLCYGMAAGLTGNYLNCLLETYSSLASTGKPPAPKKVRTVAGKTAVQVFPNKFFDKVAFPQYRCEIFLEGSELVQGEAFKSGHGLCLILGAGNFEAGTDILTKLFVENKVAIYKPNPVNAKAQEISAKVFAPLVDAGYLAYIDGDAEVGRRLIEHPLVDEILLTGGCATYDRIMWGAPDQQQQNKTRNTPLLHKRFDAELGGVGPVIVVPGKWTDAEIDHQTQQICAAKYTNSGHVCASPQIIVVDKDWPQRQQFIDSLCSHVSRTPPHPSYYPGSCERQKSWLESSANAKCLQEDDAPKLFARQVRPVFIGNAQPSDRIVKEEAFMLVFGEVPLSANNNPATFLDVAVDFCNNQVFGSLCATVLCPPSIERDLHGKFDEAVAKLNYGAIGVNTWGALVNFFPTLPWGAYPGHALTDIQSGVGKIGNTMMIDGAAKSVLYSPFWSPAHSKRPSAADYKVMKRTMWMFIYPTYSRLFALLSAAVAGI